MTSDALPHYLSLRELIYWIENRKLPKKHIPFDRESTKREVKSLAEIKAHCASGRLKPFGIKETGGPRQIDGWSHKELFNMGDGYVGFREPITNYERPRPFEMVPAPIAESGGRKTLLPRYPEANILLLSSITYAIMEWRDVRFKKSEVLRIWQPAKLAQADDLQTARRQEFLLMAWTANNGQPTYRLVDALVALFGLNIGAQGKWRKTLLGVCDLKDPERENAGAGKEGRKRSEMLADLKKLLQGKDFGSPTPDAEKKFINKSSG